MFTPLQDVTSVSTKDKATYAGKTFYLRNYCTQHSQCIKLGLTLIFSWNLRSVRDTKG